MPLETGELIEGRFMVVSEIGSGNFCRVFSGVDLDNDGSEVAIKALKPGKQCNMREEFNILQNLENHQYTATPISFGTNPVEYFEGPSLFKVGFETIGRCSERTGMLAVYFALVSLQNLHMQSKIHGDVSLRNMVLSKTPGKGQILLVDLATSTDYTLRGAERDIDRLISQMSLFNSSEFYKSLVSNYGQKKEPIGALIEKIRSHYDFALDEELDFEH